ncbi:MAG: pirin [Alteromonas sp.]|nr:pirin [Alteromonas sp.]
MNNKNLHTLISDALAIEAKEAKDAGALGFMARSLVQATLPHSKVEGNEFKRHNGAFKLTILTDSDIGLPYGSVPRLLVAWLTTEAVRTKQRELILGDSLSQFMSQLDLIPTGGRWGTITRLREQMKRLFSAAVSCTYDNGEHWAIKHMQPVSQANLWWSPKTPDQASLFESTLMLNEEFFKEIINYPIPIDMDAIKALKRSPMALDIYCWLTYRMSYLKEKILIPWCALETQFGSDYQLTRQFKNKFLHQLKTVSIIYPEAKIEDGGTGLILMPSKPHIPLLGN